MNQWLFLPSPKGYITVYSCFIFGQNVKFCPQKNLVSHHLNVVLHPKYILCVCSSISQPVKMLQTTLDYCGINAYLYPSRATAKVIPEFVVLYLLSEVGTRLKTRFTSCFKFETYRRTGGFRTSSSMVHLGLSH